MVQIIIIIIIIIKIITLEYISAIDLVIMDNEWEKVKKAMTVN
jgi:hypothetical protein